ncbi:MAG: ATP-binding protein [Desulfobacterales bacterium]|nr:ATP-binding protein [Desulfobacterales bacterium]
MTNRRPILLFWILLLVPALILAGVAGRFLSLEQERIRKASVTAMTDRARSIAGAIDQALVTVRENMTEALFDLDRDRLEARLTAWEKTNPLVRNVFIVNADGSLEYPLRSMAATSEERSFANRFDPFFSGRISFEFNTLPPDAETEQAETAEDGLLPVRASARRELYDLSRASAPKQAGRRIKTAKQDRPGFPKSGWIPWFSENRLHILGWVQKDPAGPVYGVELELMTLLSRLIADFPENTQPGTALALTDGSTTLHRTGPWQPGQHQAPAARIGVSRGLPHWQISVFVNGGAFDTGPGFLITALILLGILITAIVSGGILITRLTLANIRDAGQKTSFVASVSHELKTPLTSIRMYAELIQSGRVKDPDKQSRYLGVIVGESQRLTRLINNVLDFGKLEQGKKRYHPTLFDMDIFLEELISTQSLRVKKAGLDIIKEFHPGNYPVNTDRDALEQALLNLLDNALKYAGEGRFVKFILERDNGDILVKLCDDGPGIDKVYRKRIFEKFFRADDSLTAVQPGSGLGLSIARQMLRDLGGDLFIDPAPLSGACFIIRISYHDKN